MVNNRTSILRRVLNLRCLIAFGVTGGCSSAPNASVAGSQIKTTLPAYVHYRFANQSAEANFVLPDHPSIACAAGSDCTIAATILPRLQQEQASFSRIGQMEGESSSSTDAVAQYNSWGQPVGSFSAAAYKSLCDRASAQGYDLVVVCQKSTFEVSEGTSRREPELCGGGIIAAKSGVVIAPIQISETKDGLMIWSAGSAPGGLSNGPGSIDQAFADQVVKVLKGRAVIR